MDEDVAEGHDLPYDRLPQRRWLFVPLWGIPTNFCYAPRRVECAEHGVVVEHIPWNDGKRMAFRRQTENR
jgi:hypothetical protein